MKLVSMSMCHQTNTPILHSPPFPRWQKEKVVILMGATGTGKSRLSIDLATRFPAEVINSDKMQVYKGLDIVTNKISEEEKCGVPHHLLGVVNQNVEFTATNFCDVASLTIESILTRGLLPVIVGGSNSYIEALVDGEEYNFRSKYECCFLWLDVSMPVLHKYISKRVDEMVKAGMVDEVRNMFNPYADYSRGIRKSIGVSEFDKLFRAEPFLDKETIRRLLSEAISETKDNTGKLACRQRQKIRRLRKTKGWKLHRLDATEVFRKKGKEAEEAWEKLVAIPSSNILERFLYDSNRIPVTMAASDFAEECLVA